MLKRLISHPVVITTLLVLIVWQGCVSMFAVNPRYLPPLSAVINDIWQYRDLMLQSTWHTLLETVLGFALGTLFGIGCGILFLCALDRQGLVSTVHCLPDDSGDRLWSAGSDLVWKYLTGKSDDCFLSDIFAGHSELQARTGKC